MCTELQKGCINYPNIKAGFIGEVGSSWPITGKAMRVSFCEILLNISTVIFKDF